MEDENHYIILLFNPKWERKKVCNSLYNRRNHTSKVKTLLKRFIHHNNVYCSTSSLFFFYQIDIDIYLELKNKYNVITVVRVMIWILTAGLVAPGVYLFPEFNINNS